MPARLNADLYQEAYKAPSAADEEKEFLSRVPVELRDTVKKVVDRKVKLRVQ